MADRPLSPEEATLWARVLISVRPLKVAPAPAAKIKPLPVRRTIATDQAPVTKTISAATLASDTGLFEKLLAAGVGGARKGASPVKAVRETVFVTMPVKHHTNGPANTLDGSWDKKLARGLISPDCSIDLHGHNLSTAYATLDNALEQATRQGARMVLLVTGKPPRPDSERPHARGAIRAAIGDWLAGSRHAGAIAAVRGAHPRHGGAGALYIVLRKTNSKRIY